MNSKQAQALRFSGSILVVWILLSALAYLIVHAYQPDHQEGTLPGIKAEVVRVYDGDTITVNIPEWPSIVGHKIGIRIAHIDTPEIRGKCDYEKQQAVLARDHVRALLKGNHAHLENMQRGKYFRLVAEVSVLHQGEVTNIGDYLLAKKLARAYEGGKKVSWCSETRL